MIQKHFSLLTLLLIAAFGFASCSDSDTTTSVVNQNATFELKLDEEHANFLIKSALVHGKELNSGAEVKLNIDNFENSTFELELRPGVYTLNIIASGLLNDKEVELKGHVENIEIKGSSHTPVKMISAVISEGFVIEEIFFAGNRYPETNKSYIGDQYFKITNNSDKVRYADGLTIAEGEFTTYLFNDYTPNRTEEETPVQALYQVPGNGTEYPVQPGKSIIICDKAINHLEETGIPTTFDLSNADFEWFDESPIPRIKDTDNPDVPNLNKIYSLSYTIWLINQQGNRSYLLLRMGKDDESFLAENEKEYSYYHPGAERTITRKGYFVPNEWIIDAVTLSNKDKHQWLSISSSLDAGYTHCGENSADPDRKGTSVIRKISHTNENGRKVLQDTNNSSEDFIPTSKPSLAK